eukprot:Skav210714  [mRNA]  locus=scaffold1582:487379:487789:+ [translate_table: standard]
MRYSVQLGADPQRKLQSNMRNTFIAAQQNILGGMASMQDIGAVRRLLFESQTLVMAQLRELVTNPEAGLARKLPPVEREAKMRQLKARLTESPMRSIYICRYQGWPRVHHISGELAWNGCAVGSKTGKSKSPHKGC